MRTAKTRRGGFTLIELLVVVAIIALLVSILLPSLSRAKALAKSVVCQNRFRGARTGFDYYSSDFNGTWMANWSGQRAHIAWTQWPHTMLLYCKGVGIPDGKPLLDDEGNWFNIMTESRSPKGPFTSNITPATVPQVHCPAMDELGESVIGQWYNYITMSQLIPYRYINGNWTWNDWNLEKHFKPDSMTHPGSTVHLQCMVKVPSEDDYNVWMAYGAETYDPHLGKSNYLFADGHVESLAPEQTDEQMWKDMYEMGQ